MEIQFQNRCLNEDEEMDMCNEEEIKNVNLPQNTDQVISRILSNTMKYLSTEDILNCRLVNLKWSQVATQVILKRNDVWVKLDWSQLSQSFLKPQRRGAASTKSLSLKALTDLIRTSLSSSRSFPFTKFQFKDGNLDANDFQEFVNVFGEKLTGLIVIQDSMKINMKVRTFGKLLTDQAPNIELLELPLPQSWMNSSIPLLIPQNTTLPKLKFVQLYYDDDYNGWSRIAKELKNAAINVKAFRTPCNIKWWRPQNQEVKILFETAKADVLIFLAISKEGIEARTAYSRMVAEMQVYINFMEMGFRNFGEFLYHLDDILILRTNGEEDYLFLRTGAEGENLAHITALVQRTPATRTNYTGYRATLINTTYAPLENLLKINYDLTITLNPQMNNQHYKRKRGYENNERYFRGLFAC